MQYSTDSFPCSCITEGVINLEFMFFIFSKFSFAITKTLSIFEDTFIEKLIISPLFLISYCSVGVKEILIKSATSFLHDEKTRKSCRKVWENNFDSRINYRIFASKLLDCFHD